MGGQAATLREWVEERWGQFQARTGEKPKRGRDKPIKIIRLKPVVPVDAEIVQAADSAETVEPASLSQPAYRRRKRKLAIAGHRSEQLILPHVVDVSGSVLPGPAVLLRDPAARVDRLTDEEIRAQAQVLTQALENLGIDGQVIQTHVGPVVTMYEFEPAPGVKVARIVNLADDLALALRATGIRIVAPIPGKSVVGIEVPNPRREDVMLKELVLSEAYVGSRSLLKLALGKDIFGTPVVADLRSMPHLLVAGATGSGKSVGLNTRILSLLFAAPATSRCGIPHLWRPVITQPKAASRGLMLAVKEMDLRYKLMAEYGARNIEAYNRAVAEAQGVPPLQPAETLEWEVVAGTEPQPAYLSEEERLAAGEMADPGGP